MPRSRVGGPQWVMGSVVWRSNRARWDDVVVDTSKSTVTERLERVCSIGQLFDLSSNFALSTHLVPVLGTGFSRSCMMRNNAADDERPDNPPSE